MTKANIARIYKRQFSSTSDVAAFINSVAIIEDRLSAVDAKYRLYHCENDPLIVFEIWEYPDEEAMEWVQSAMEGAVAIPRRFTIDTEAFTATVKASIDIED